MQNGEGNLYTQRFFSHQHEGSLRSARKIVPIVMQLVAPKSLLDVGCGTGGWLRAFADAGVADYLGIDGDYVDRSALSIPADRFQSHDLKKPFELGRKFDLAISMEVAEHLPPARADAFVASLTRHAPVVLFSAAIPLQGGTGHLNEQFQSYWIERFAQLEYEAIDCIRRRLWRDPDVLPWYAQNAFLFAHRDAMTSVLARERDDAKSAMPADVVHPGVFSNSLAQLDYKVRVELSQPTREQRALAANVPVWLANRARDPNDAASLNALKKARGELALMFADAAPDRLPLMFAGPLGISYRQLIRSNLRYEKFSDAERAFVESQFPPVAIDWSDQKSPGRFLAASLYHLPHRLPVKFNREAIPKWLIEDVASYLAQPIARFNEPTDATAYAAFAKDFFSQAEQFLRSETDPELRHRVGWMIVAQPHASLLAQIQSPAAREAEIALSQLHKLLAQ